MEPEGDSLVFVDVPLVNTLVVAALGWVAAIGLGATQFAGRAQWVAVALAAVAVPAFTWRFLGPVALTLRGDGLMSVTWRGARGMCLARLAEVSYEVGYHTAELVLRDDSGDSLRLRTLHEESALFRATLGATIVRLGKAETLRGARERELLFVE